LLPDALRIIWSAIRLVDLGQQSIDAAPLPKNIDRFKPVDPEEALDRVVANRIGVAPAIELELKVRVE